MPRSPCLTSIGRCQKKGRGLPRPLIYSKPSPTTLDGVLLDVVMFMNSHVTRAYLYQYSAKSRV
jgi:hypothetical protein